MKDLYLKDILNLSEEDIQNARIALNMKVNNQSAFQVWEESKPDNREVEFSYWSHYSPKKRNFLQGQICFGFVQLPNDNKKWLLVTVGKIIKVPKTNEKPQICEYEEIDKFSGFLGRLIVEINKGNKFSTYVFKLTKFINEIKVTEILSQEYKKIEFCGYDNVHLSFNELNTILNSEKYSSYKQNLSCVKGIYCLTDTKAGKLYIGSAYGEHGFAQRWGDYIDTKNGGNAALIELYNKKGESYFENNFEFTIIEIFAKNTDITRITNRESYWKRVFLTRENGYNRN